MPACATIKSCYRFFLLILAFIPCAHAAPFKITSANVEHIGNGYVFTGTVDYTLTPRVMEALENGVPITFFQQFELIRSTPLLGKYWHWNTKLWKTTLRYQLRYHALAQQYVLRSLDTHHMRNFPTLAGALEALGQIEKLSLPPDLTQHTKHLILRLRSGIDLHALPTPMRPGALLSNKWQLTSTWVEATWR